MRTLELARYRRARVWIGTLPDAIYEPQTSLIHSLPAKGTSKLQFKTAAVELLVPTGAMCRYGLLGGQVSPDSVGCLQIEVCVSSSNGRLLGDTLAKSVDEVRVGLPAEYAEAVVAGATLAADQLDAIAAGRLLINCAAHGAVGSSSLLFKHLAATLVRIFNSARPESSDEELANLFPAEFI